MKCFKSSGFIEINFYFINFKRTIYNRVGIPTYNYMFARKLGMRPSKDMSPFDRMEKILPKITLLQVYDVFLRILLTVTSLLCILLIHIFIYIPHSSNNFIYEVYIRYPMEVIGFLFAKSFNVTRIMYPSHSKKNKFKPGYISISNHGSFLDSAIFVTILRNRAVGKYIPHYAIGFRSAQVILKCVMVKRDNKASRGNALNTIQEYIEASKRKKSPDNFHFFVDGATMPVVPSNLTSFTWSLGAFQQKTPIDAYYISYKTPGNHFNCNYINPANLHDIFFTYFVPKEYKIQYIKRYYPQKTETEEDIVKWANDVRKDYSKERSLRMSEYSFFDKFILKRAIDHRDNTILFKEYVPWCVIKKYFKGANIRDVLSLVSFISQTTKKRCNRKLIKIKTYSEFGRYVFAKIQTKDKEDILEINTHKVINEKDKYEQKGNVSVVSQNGRKFNIDTIDLLVAYISQKTKTRMGLYFYRSEEDMRNGKHIHFYK